MTDNQYNSHTPKENHNLKLKELSCINQIIGILKENRDVDQTLKQIANKLPEFWQYPDYTNVRIHFGGTNYTNNKFELSPWKIKKAFSSILGKVGYIEVYYSKEFMEADEGPFLESEINLLSIVTSKINGYLNTIEVKKKKPDADFFTGQVNRENKSLENESVTHKLLQRFINKNNNARDIYHDLMPYKVKEILLVANLYDAYGIEREGRFSEYLLGEYSSMNLTSIPRITGVSSEDEAMEELQKKNYDLVIIMMGTHKENPSKLSKKIKDIYPFLPTYLLLHNNRDAAYFKGNFPKSFDSVFVWNGESQIFFAMIKLVEDKVNLYNDTRKGMSRVILLVEDTPKYYSQYLPMLYNIVMEQTRRIIDDVSTDELYKVLRLRARPKIIHTNNYEEAVQIFNDYKDYILCLISDVKFYRNGELDEKAGLNLVKYAKSKNEDLPTIIQSSQKENMSIAYLLNASFIDKNSDSLLLDFKHFIIHYLGFGDFIFRDKNGKKIAVAKTLREFEKHLIDLPEESILYHASKNHFSLWLMARGEIQIARIINPGKVSDFKTSEKLRNYLVEVLQRYRNEQKRGKIIPFHQNYIGDSKNIIKLTDGTLGGKGRGLAFINSLIHNFDFKQIVEDINIRNPVTYIIGTDEYETFLENNNLHSKLKLFNDYDVIKNMFLESHLSEPLIEKLRLILAETHKPIAVRSSGLFEDSTMQPFAGIFETYLLPNNHHDDQIRLKQTTDAIKLVYASVYSEMAKGYVEAVDYRIEEEKMAVIIQEVVGNKQENYFYPHFSGVAQSYNFYPVAHMKPEEGFSNIAVGLGKYVVDGEKSYRFSPKYPDLENYSTKDLYKNSQTEFYAVNLKERELDLRTGDEEGLSKLHIEDAEKHGTLKHMVSVYDHNNNIVVPGIHKQGPRIVNFANILKHDYIPLAQTLETILKLGEEAIGSPVEIEFAVDLNKDKNYRSSLYLLQIKPLLGSYEEFNINMDEEDTSKIFLYTENGLGNGMIDHIHDMIFVDIRKFEKAHTTEMAEEIDELNRLMMEEDKQYVLIGPGRWGTRDPWIGIPVTWPQICNAKIIVETSLANFPLDASSGSHFFHNVTSADVGYLSVEQEKSNNKINWDILDKQKVIRESKYFKHIRFENPLIIKMDGKKRIAIVSINE